MTLPKVRTSSGTTVQNLWVYIPKEKFKYNYCLRIERERGRVKSEIREHEAKPHGKRRDAWERKYNMRQASWSL